MGTDGKCVDKPVKTCSPGMIMGADAICSSAPAPAPVRLTVCGLV